MKTTIICELCAATDQFYTTDEARQQGWGILSGHHYTIHICPDCFTTLKRRLKAEASIRRCTSHDTLWV